MFTASASPASIATSIEALRILKEEPQRRTKLWENSTRLFNGIRALGLETGTDVVSPVIAVKMPDELTTIAKWSGLFQAGVYVNMAVPPGTPNRLCLLRCSVSAAHTTEEIDAIIAAFKQVVLA
jgi:7-keto-8-aminopelargonate synthetase-like enzyme